MQKILMNFNVSSSIKERFDVICHVNGKTRTSVLVELMTNYVLDEGKRLIERQKEFGHFDRSFQDSNDLKGYRNQADADPHLTRSARQTWGEDDLGLPSPMLSDGQGEW